MILFWGTIVDFNGFTATALYCSDDGMVTFPCLFGICLCLCHCVGQVMSPHHWWQVPTTGLGTLSPDGAALE